MRSKRRTASTRRPQAPGSPSLRATLSEAITRDILRGTLRPGDLLVERRLAERFGVSKTPVREALMALQQDGLVEVVPRAGYFVTKLSIHEVRNIFQLRQLLEAEAAALAAEHARAADLQHLDDCLRQLAALEFPARTAAKEAADNERYIALNRRFHTTIARASDNRLLAEFIERLITSMDRVLSHDPLSRDTLRSLGREHGAIVQVIRDRNADEARRLMTEHVIRTGQRILGAL